MSAMDQIEIGGRILEVDRQRTKEIYYRMLNWDQLDFDNNARIVQRRHTPLDQVDLLRRLGVDPWRPCLRTWDTKRSFDLPDYTRVLSSWFLFGRFVGETPSEKVSFDRRNWLWADTNRDVMPYIFDGGVDDLEEEPDLIYILASNLFPWYYGEACELRLEKSQPCEICGQEFRHTGFLKRRSRIPEWQDLPELRAVLMGRKHRVYVEFCGTCGQMEHQIVPNKPPFRTKPSRCRPPIENESGYTGLVCTFKSSDLPDSISAMFD